MAGKFQWPPRSVPEQDLGAPSTPGYWKPQPRVTPPELPRGSSTPNATTQSVAPPAVILPVSVKTATPRSAWRQIESTFLGLTKPPFQDRAADAGWSPDAVGSFCPRCATSTGFHEASLAGCTRCSALKMPWDRAVRLGRYEGLLRTCIQEVKYSAWRRLGIDLGGQLGMSIRPALAGVEPSRLVLVPIPAPFWRRLSRGIDHTAAIARGIHRITGGTVAPVLRRKHRRPQVGLSNSDRQRNAAGSMSFRGHPRFDGCTVLLIDDVRTTGATMGEAAKVLRRELKARDQVPAGIWSCTLAVAEFGDSDGQ